MMRDSCVCVCVCVCNGMLQVAAATCRRGQARAALAAAAAAPAATAAVAAAAPILIATVPRGQRGGCAGSVSSSDSRSCLLPATFCYLLAQFRSFPFIIYTVFHYK